MKLANGKVTLYAGDCLEVLATLAENSIDAVVTDPPYELGFMGKSWDASGVAFCPDTWRQVMRVLKPGGHMVAFGAPKNYHRLACAIEDAGFEVRDSVSYLYSIGPLLWTFGSGFPKSLNVSKALDDVRCACDACKETRPQATPSDREDLRDLRGDLDSKEPLSGGAEQDVFAGMQRGSDFTKQDREDDSGTDALRSLRDAGISRSVPQSADGSSVLQPHLPSEGSVGSDAYTTCAQGPRGVDGRKREEFSRENVGREKPGMEGRSDLQTTARELQGRDLCESAGLGEADGAGGRLHNAASSGDGADVRFSSDSAGGGQPQRSQSSKQRSKQSRTVADKCGPQAWGGWPVCERCGKPRIPDGLGTALKPAAEFICLARKPLSEGTVAANVLRWGTGAINVDATRVEHNEECKPMKAQSNVNSIIGQSGRYEATTELKPGGRWPANLCHSGEQEVLDLFPVTAPAKKSMRGLQHSGRHGGLADIGGNIKHGTNSLRGHEDDGGSAARFFYCAKANKHDRAGSKHPTVKPVSLMRWLVRMVTPPGGTVLDPFAGSGTTGLAAVLEGFEVQLIEREAEYQADIQRRFDD